MQTSLDARERWAQNCNHHAQCCHSSFSLSLVSGCFCLFVFLWKASKSRFLCLINLVCPFHIIWINEYIYSEETTIHPERQTCTRHVYQHIALTGTFVAVCIIRLWALVLEPLLASSSSKEKEFWGWGTTCGMQCENTPPRKRAKAWSKQVL